MDVEKACTAASSRLELISTLGGSAVKLLKLCLESSANTGYDQLLTMEKLRQDKNRRVGEKALSYVCSASIPFVGRVLD